MMGVFTCARGRRSFVGCPVFRRTTTGTRPSPGCRCTRPRCSGWWPSGMSTTIRTSEVASTASRSRSRREGLDPRVRFDYADESDGPLSVAPFHLHRRWQRSAHGGRGRPAVPALRDLGTPGARPVDGVRVGGGVEPAVRTPCALQDGRRRTRRAADPAWLLRWSGGPAGSVDHAIRFTAPTTAPRYLWPARHQAGSDCSAPPMGAPLPWSASGFDTSGFSPADRTVLAMQTYGLVLADNGIAVVLPGRAERMAGRA